MVLHGHISSVRIEPPTDSYVKCWCLLWCLLSAVTFPCGCLVHKWKINGWGSHHHNSLEYILGRHVCLLVMVCGPCQDYRVAAPPIALSRGSFMLLIQLSPSNSIHMVWHIAFGLSRIIQSLYLPCMLEMGLLNQVVFHLMTQLTPNL